MFGTNSILLKPVSFFILFFTGFLGLKSETAAAQITILVDEKFANTLDKLDMKDVELIPQTMAPFPWHFGGQRFQNIFVFGY